MPTNQTTQAVVLPWEGSSLGVSFLVPAQGEALAVELLPSCIINTERTNMSRQTQGWARGTSTARRVQGFAHYIRLYWGMNGNCNFLQTATVIRSQENDWKIGLEANKNSMDHSRVNSKTYTLLVDPPWGYLITFADFEEWPAHQWGRSHRGTSR